MKKVALFATILAPLMTMTARAQPVIDFDDLPDASTPTAIPVAYGGMSWYGMDYVSSAQYVWANGVDDYGKGFLTGVRLYFAEPTRLPLKYARVVPEKLGDDYGVGNPFSPGGSFVMYTLTIN